MGKRAAIQAAHAYLTLVPDVMTDDLIAIITAAYGGMIPYTKLREIMSRIEGGFKWKNVNLRGWLKDMKEHGRVAVLHDRGTTVIKLLKPTST